VLQRVRGPICVGGSGNPEKDPALLEKVAEVAEGERIILNSARLDMDYKRVGEAAKRYGHVVVAFTALDMSLQRTLNRELMAVGLPKESIIMDPTTAALGYGLEYSFSVAERIRLAGLLGDSELQMPLSSAPSNTWAAREAWMKELSWGPRERRGPAWEVATAIPMLLAGCDFFMMIHPEAAATVKFVIDSLTGEQKAEAEEVSNWVGLKV
jgi:acetyl-CoA decarbonylase/synthase complex subunit delta